jgi:hypothetical protein
MPLPVSATMKLPTSAVALHDPHYIAKIWCEICLFLSHCYLHELQLCTQKHELQVMPWLPPLQQLAVLVHLLCHSVWLECSMPQGMAKQQQYTPAIKTISMIKPSGNGGEELILTRSLK